MCGRLAFDLAVLAAVLLIVPAVCPADCNTLEQTFGATNVCGLVGNGGMVAAFSCRGEMTVLRWPSPTYYDQLLYISSNAADARRRPRFGALEQMGAFWGLKLMLTDGSSEVTWLRDEPWRVETGYLHPRSGVLVHRYANDELKLAATSYALIDPEFDILAWRLEVEREEGSPVKAAEAIFYANISPCATRLPYVPMFDWALDMYNDFAAIYLHQQDAILHMLPVKRSLADLDDIMKASEEMRPQMVEEIYRSMGSREGVYLALGFEQHSWSHQVGMDRADVCSYMKEFAAGVDWESWGLPGNPLENIAFCFSSYTELLYRIRSWTHMPQGAYEDAGDGVLSGSVAAAVQVDEAIARGVLTEGESSGAATVYIAASGRLTDAVRLLDRARGMGWDELLSRTEGFFKGWLARAWLPDTDDELIRNFYLRTLISIKQTQDRTTGARPASISTQPPYAEDWPRDSAFNNYFLDMAGYHTEAELNDLFFASVVRTYPFLMAPAGTYEMNYYADGAPGGPLFFEIDNTGLILWQMSEHAKFLDEGERAAYLEAVYPAIQLSAAGLAACRDPETGLQCLAWEDGNPRGMTQTLHGASAVLAGLKAALDAAREVGDGLLVEVLEDRIDELEAAIVDNLYAEADGFQGGSTARAWILWPARIFDYGDPRWTNHVVRLKSDIWRPVNEDVEQFGYEGKGAWALAEYCRELGDEECLADLRDWVRRYIELIAVPGTLHVGEVYCRVDIDEDGIFDLVESRVAIPHIWPAVLLSATALLSYGAKEPPPGFPEPEYNPADTEEEGQGERGCGCVL
ncbi:MAG TPA: hypothetical protein ENF73_05080 [Proteobacteria bacterium]|nr:hypothetical protein [Pseudomonadota bacterium]